MANVENFTNKIVGVIVGIIVVSAVAVPIIMGLMADPDGSSGPKQPVVDPNSTAGTILGIVPVFFVLAILMVIVRMFISNKRDNDYEQ